MNDVHRFGTRDLFATVSAEGAELRSLRDSSGGEWLWQAGPEWPRRAPVLFPLVGRLPGDVLRHGGRATLESPPGGGAAFTIIIPLRRGPDR